MAAARSATLKGARRPVWAGGAASCMVAASDVKRKTAATGLSMVVDARSTVAQASAARVVGATSTIKEADTASHTVAGSPVPSRTALRSR
ncbi:hypothetical protein ON010_g18811 [Phytophthora cinnamomi]|nr:hypothetical protein ON010_g18811 [Phytophthora cinnamomi]